MKKLSILLLILPFIFFSCSSDDNERMIEPTKPTEPTQDYTSFVFEVPSDVKYTFPNCVAGYYTKEGLCIKIADLGDLDYKTPSKEIKVENDTLVNVYFFTDLISPRVFNTAFKLERNKKNIFTFKGKISGTPVDKGNPKEYPH